MLVFAGTIFTSAFLLFLVQPIVAKQILPWFGGSAMVWTICMVFFQSALLAGYAYADQLTHRFVPRRQAIIHMALLLGSLFTLPIVANPAWKPLGDEEPTWLILGLLTGTIGMPYFLLSTTGPLMQSWCAGVLHSKSVYRLFSLSNLASLAALVSYPFLVEPHAALLKQSQGWSLVFGVFVLFCGGAAVVFVRNREREDHRPIHCVYPDEEGESPPSRRDLLLWLSLSAMGSWLLLAITNHLTQNIASIPFLWLVPLTLYLLTFVFCFESDNVYRRAWYLLPVALLLGFCGWGLHSSKISLHLQYAIPLYLAGLFGGCMFLHGELAALKPPTRYLTRYYLMLSLGGALGGMVVGLLAPRVLPAYDELGIGFILIALLAALLMGREGKRRLMAGAMVCAGVFGYFLYLQVEREHSSAHQMSRSFYGALRTRDTTSDLQELPMRVLMHGPISHGEQYLDPELKGGPTSYYGPDSGIGRLLITMDQPARRVGVIGLGAGTLAAYGMEGDQFTFYEINPQVIQMAREEFTFLKDCKAQTEMVLGDARLSMEREPSRQFDVLVIDAFSGDAIPVHLITREAVALYKRHMAPGGVMAFHVSNRYLELAPMVKLLARTAGQDAMLISDDASKKEYSSSDWVLVSDNHPLLTHPKLMEAADPIVAVPGLLPWSDDFNNLFDVIKSSLLPWRHVAAFQVEGDDDDDD